MDFIYYYPPKDEAPDQVGRKVFEYIWQKKHELPFDNIKLLTSSDYKKKVEKLYNVEVITLNHLKKIDAAVVHIPIGPLIFPNKKFMLHLFSIFERQKLVLQYPGDIRTELKMKFSSGKLTKRDVKNLFFYSPTYIFIPYLLKFASKVVTHSYLMSDFIGSRYGVENDVVIPNGVDGFWLDGKVEDVELDGDPSIFYHGRLSPEKGVDLLLRGFAKAVEEKSNGKLYIAGKGPQFNHLRALSQKLGLDDNIVFLGHIDKNYIKSILCSVDAAVYPSVWDNFPLAILEGLASANCPVYFSRLAGLYDFVLKEDFDLYSFYPTVENIAGIVRDIIDENHGRGVIKKQKKFAAQYKWDKVIDRYISLYKSV